MKEDVVLMGLGLGLGEGASGIVAVAFHYYCLLLYTVYTVCT